MGQATLDLPDPLEQPSETAAGTDDLLAQLAGDEIDRLIAETDTDRLASVEHANPAPAAPPLLAPTHPPEPGVPVAGLLDSSPQAESEPAPEPQVQLSDYLGQLAAKTQDETAPADGGPLSRQAADPLSARESAIEKATAITDPFDDDVTLAAAERGALNTADVARDDEAIPARLEAESPIVRRRPPIFVRFLAWLNAPLDSLSDDVRELIGKIAILTTVNALSVLVYVLFFRKHG